MSKKVVLGVEIHEPIVYNERCVENIAKNEWLPVTSMGYGMVTRVKRREVHGSSIN